MIQWPGGARAAVASTFDFDAVEVWIGDDPLERRQTGDLVAGDLRREARDPPRTTYRPLRGQSGGSLPSQANSAPAL